MAYLMVDPESHTDFRNAWASLFTLYTISFTIVLATLLYSQFWSSSWSIISFSSLRIYLSHSFPLPVLYTLLYVAAFALYLHVYHLLKSVHIQFWSSTTLLPNWYLISGMMLLKAAWEFWLTANTSCTLLGRNVRENNQITSPNCDENSLNFIV